MNIKTAVVTALGAMLLPTAAVAQIKWAASLESAMAQAQAEKKVVFIALNMDDERANDQMVSDHYQDPVLVKLSQSTINLFCSNNEHGKGSCSRCKGTTCAIHRANDFAVRRQILKVDGDAPVVAPQHLFVSPEGKILSSASYFITKGELEWMWVQAIRELHPEFAWERSGRSRAPELLRKGEADKTTLAEKPPTDKEVQKALADIKKLGGGGRGGAPGGGGRDGWREFFESAQKNSRVIIRSEDKRALDWGRNSLRGYRQFRDALIRDIGKLSPKPWALQITEWLDDKSEETRKTTAIALENIKNPKAVAALKKAIKQEPEPDIHGRMLRAMAASAPTDKSVIAAVAKTAKTHKVALVRAHAVVAVGKLEDRDAVMTSLHAALQDGDVLVRSVAAFVIAIRQDKSLLDQLGTAIQAETEESVKVWMQKAVTALHTADIKAFHDFLPKMLDGADPGAEIDRWRDAGGRDPGAGGGDSGGGAEKDGGDGKKAKG